MSLAPWRAALRMARRECGRARTRSALVVALIALPVAAVVAGDVVDRTFHISPQLAYQRADGAASADLTAVGAPVRQTPSGADYETVGAPTSARVRASALRTVLGPVRLLPRVQLSGATVRTPDGLTDASLTGVDLADPATAGLAPLLAGHVPAGPGEIAVTPALAAAGHLHLGATLQVLQPAGTYRVVGIVEAVADGRTLAAFTVPAALRAAGTGASTDTLVAARRPVTWSEVQRLDDAGWVVDSRAVAAHPPPASASAVSYRPGGTSVLRTYAAPGALIVGLALLELILLAGPAFAVMARRQERSLALIGATGGRGRDLRNTVLAAGVVLGATAAVLGAATGILAGRLAVPVIAEHAHRPGPFTVRVPEIAAIAAASLLTALAAAAVPARTASGIDVAATLAGRVPRRPARLRLPLLAVVLVAVGVAVAGTSRVGGAALTGAGTDTILAGVVLVELGVVLATPTLLMVLARLGRRLPLAPRLALRDAGRNRSAAAPAAAAVMAAVMACVAMLIGSSTYDARAQRLYVPTMVHGEVSVALGQFAVTHPVTGAVTAVMRAALPTTRVALLSDPGCDPSAEGCTTVDAVSVHVPAGRVRTTRYRNGSGGTTVVTGPGGLMALFGIGRGRATAALAAGRAVVADGWAVSHGRATLQIDESLPHDRQLTRLVSVPAVAETAGFAGAQVVLPPSLAEQIGTGSYPAVALAEDRAVPTALQTDRLRGALARIAAAHPPPGDTLQGVAVQVETGYHDRLAVPIFWILLTVALVAVVATLIATGLSNLDRREDFVTLESVGAAGSTRRVVATCRALVIAGLGTTLGALAGLVPVVAWVDRQNRAWPTSTPPGAPTGGSGLLQTASTSLRYHLSVPWAGLAAVVIGVPLIAALGAGLVCRSRLDPDRGRRRAIA